MIEYDEYKVKILAQKSTLETLRAALKLSEAQAEIAKLEAESAKEGFWNDVANSQKVLQRTKQLKNKCAKFDKLYSTWEDLLTLCQMGQEEDDDSLLPELEEEYKEFEKELEETETLYTSLRRIRWLQRHYIFPRRRWWYRGAGLGPDALQNVYPLG